MDRLRDLIIDLLNIFKNIIIFPIMAIDSHPANDFSQLYGHIKCHSFQFAQLISNETLVPSF